MAILTGSPFSMVGVYFNPSYDMMMSVPVPVLHRPGQPFDVTLPPRTRATVFTDGTCRTEVMPDDPPQRADLPEGVPEGFEHVGVVMSNLEREIEPGAEEKLASGAFWGEHTAWEFWAAVWFDREAMVFRSTVKRYQQVVDHKESNTLRGLMEENSGSWGWD